MARKIVGIILMSLGALHIFINILVIRAFIPILPYFSDTGYVETRGAIIDIFEPQSEDIVISDTANDSSLEGQEWPIVLQEQMSRKSGYTDVDYWVAEDNIMVRKIVRTKYKQEYELGDIVTVYYEEKDHNVALVPELSGNNLISQRKTARIALVTTMTLSPWIIMFIIGVIQLAIYNRRKRDK